MTFNLVEKFPIHGEPAEMKWYEAVQFQAVANDRYLQMVGPMADGQSINFGPNTTIEVGPRMIDIRDISANTLRSVNKDTNGSGYMTVHSSCSFENIIAYTSYLAIEDVKNLKSMTISARELKLFDLDGSIDVDLDFERLGKVQIENCPNLKAKNGIEFIALPLEDGSSISLVTNGIEFAGADGKGSFNAMREHAQILFDLEETKLEVIEREAGLDFDKLVANVNELQEKLKTDANCDAGEQIKILQTQYIRQKKDKDAARVEHQRRWSHANALRGFFENQQQTDTAEKKLAGALKL